MHLDRIIRFTLSALLCGGLLLIPASVAGAQEDTTSTTQLDLGGGSSEATTPTTQLDLGATEAPPNRVDAGAGGSLSNARTPFALIVLAGGLVVVTAAATRKMRTQ